MKAKVDSSSYWACVILWLTVVFGKFVCLCWGHVHVSKHGMLHTPNQIHFLLISKSDVTLEMAIACAESFMHAAH